MKLNQELWNDASAGRPVFKGKEHQYIIDNGCKVEYYDDGRIRIFNTRIGGDFYKELKESDVFDFYTMGFDIASLKLSIRTIEKIIERRKKYKNSVRNDKSIQAYVDMLDDTTRKLNAIEKCYKQ